MHRLPRVTTDLSSGLTQIATSRAWLDSIHRMALTRLNHFRRMAGLSQRELAERTGVTHGAISCIESDKAVARIETRSKLAAALGRRTSDVFPLGGLRAEDLAIVLSLEERMRVLPDTLTPIQRLAAAAGLPEHDVFPVPGQQDSAQL